MHLLVCEDDVSPLTLSLSPSPSHPLSLTLSLSPSLSQSVTTWPPGQSSHWACLPVGVATTCTPTAGRGDDRHKLVISTLSNSHTFFYSLFLSLSSLSGLLRASNRNMVVDISTLSLASRSSGHRENSSVLSASPSATPCSPSCPPSAPPPPPPRPPGGTWGSPSGENSWTSPWSWPSPRMF